MGVIEESGGAWSFFRENFTVENFPGQRYIDSWILLSFYNGTSSLYTSSPDSSDDGFSVNLEIYVELRCAVICDCTLMSKPKHYSKVQVHYCSNICSCP